MPHAVNSMLTSTLLSLQDLLSLLQPTQSDAVCVLSLHGMGGIGKTTLARELYNRLSNSSLQFTSRTFLEVGQDPLLLHKQHQLLQLLRGTTVPMAGSSAEQQKQLEKRTKEGGAMLLVLDDIWNTGQRDGLLCLSVLPAGSRVILTARVSSNLQADSSFCNLRPVEFLALADARALLCRHAFEVDQVPPGYEAAVEHTLTVCRGLPLARQVVGAGLQKSSRATAKVVVVTFPLQFCMSCLQSPQ